MRQCDEIEGPGSGRLSPLALRPFQLSTLAVMVLGYTGYYACRSNFSVALPLLVEDLQARGWTATAARLHFGEVASLGVLAYAAGKFLNGPLTEYIGGRRAFLGGMVLSSLFTLLFAGTNTVPVFTLAWIGNRLVQTGGWVGMVKITSRWFAYDAYARAMAIVSMSYLFGDAAVRWAMGGLLSAGLGWRGLFVIVALGLASLAALSTWALRESPSERALPEPEAHPENLFADKSPDVPPTFRTLARTFLASRAFWLICAISFALTLLRETFNTWTPMFFVQEVGMPADAAARWSALFPLSGGVAVLGAGWLGDRVGRRGRAWVMIIGLATTSIGLLLLGRTSGEAVAATALIAAIGFSMLAPYSYLAGAISLDFGGKTGSAAACGFIDGVGYLGGVLAGSGVARLATSFEWSGAFASLSAIALLGCFASVGYLRLIRPVPG